MRMISDRLREKAERSKRGFLRVCSLMVAKRLYDEGETVKGIAGLAGRSESTICRWLKDAR